MKQIKIIEYLLLGVTLAVLICAVGSKSLLLIILSAILLICQIVSFCLIHYWFMEPLYWAKQSLKRVDHREFSEKDFEEGASKFILLKEFEPLLKHYVSLKICRNNAEIFTKQTELTALQSQINPHFLYNTLDTIRGQAMCDDNFEVANMIETLACFFRYSISRKGNMVTLRDELNNIHNYMRIQQYRFHHRFSMEIIVDDEDAPAYDFYVPRLILQPIVENAILHGLEEKRENAQVIIEVSAADDLIITISDNGKGMSLKELDELNERIHLEQSLTASDEEKKRGSGIALPNINKRIQLLFGDRYGLNIYSSEGCGTDVELLLPIKRHAEELIVEKDSIKNE